MPLYIVLWIIFWFRPHFGFVATCVGVMIVIDWIFLPLGVAYVAATDPVALLDLESWVALPVDYIRRKWSTFTLFAGVGVAIVVFRKWLNSRMAPRDSKLDAEMAAIRAEIAVREQGNG
jgi:hypothetical protein